jgi:hypothetical protein
MARRYLRLRAQAVACGRLEDLHAAHDAADQRLAPATHEPMAFLSPLHGLRAV